MREHLPAERQDWTGGEEDAGTRELVRRYIDAGVATDVDGLAALLRDDVRCSMPPTPGLYVGRDAVLNDWVESGFEGMKHLRAVLTSVNRQPAVAFYIWRKREGAYLPLTIDVLRVTGGRSPRSSRSTTTSSRGSGCRSACRRTARVVPVWTLALRGGARVAVVAAQWCDAFGVVTRGRCSCSCATASPGRSSDATPGSGSAAPASAPCNPGVARRGAHPHPRARTVTCQSTPRTPVTQ
jgi:hypothetical protein